jgi:hypothetical protein
MSDRTKEIYEIRKEIIWLNTVLGVKENRLNELISQLDDGEQFPNESFEDWLGQGFTQIPPVHEDDIQKDPPLNI